MLPMHCHQREFDQKDFIGNRSAKSVEDVYSNKWFYRKDDGKLMFELATIHLVSGQTQFISGRHRISVLIQHMESIPIAFCQNAVSFANSLGLEIMDLSKSICLPSRPMKNF